MATEKAKFILEGDSSDLTNAVDKSDKKMKGLNKTFLAVGAGAVGAGAGILKMADMASDLNESINVVTSSLGESSDEVIAWSETSIQAMGISQTEALKTAGIYGNMAVGLGLSTDEASKLAMELTQLSADMASFYNVSQETAALALKGIFTGESESLKQYGIMIDETTLKQYGYNQSMTQSEKIMVRYKAVMDQTASAQGDFVKTSDGMANASRIMKQEFIQLFTILGGYVLPAVESLINVINNGLNVAIALASGETASLSESQLVLYNVLIEIGKAFSVVGSVIKEVFTLSIQIAQPIVETFLVAIQSLLPPLINLVKIIAEALKPALDVLVEVLIYLSNLIAEYLQPILVKLGALIGELVEALSPLISALGDILTPIIIFLGQVLTVLIEIIAGVINIVLDIFGPALVTLANIISAVLTPVVNALNNIFTFLGNIIGGLSSSISTFSNVVLTGLANAFRFVLAPIQDVINILNQLWNIVINVSNAMQNMALSITSSMQNIPFVGRFIPGGYSFPIMGQTSNYGGNVSNSNRVTNNFNITPRKTMSFREAYRQGTILQQTKGGILS